MTRARSERPSRSPHRPPHCRFCRCSAHNFSPPLTPCPSSSWPAWNQGGYAAGPARPCCWRDVLGPARRAPPPARTARARGHGRSASCSSCRFSDDFLLQRADARSSPSKRGAITAGHHAPRAIGTGRGHRLVPAEPRGLRRAPLARVAPRGPEARLQTLCEPGHSAPGFSGTAGPAGLRRRVRAHGVRRVVRLDGSGTCARRPRRRRARGTKEFPNLD